MSLIKSKINRKSNKAVATNWMQFVLSTSKPKLYTISLHKHSAIISTKVLTPSEPTYKICTSIAITEIHRFQPNTSFLLHITKPIIPIDEQDKQANITRSEPRKREQHRNLQCWVSRLGFYVKMGAGQKRENERSEKRRKMGTG